VNSEVLTGNSAGLRTVLSSRLSHRELRSLLRESHSFLSLPADTTMASSQGTFQHPFLAIHSADILFFKYDIFSFKYDFLIQNLRFVSFFRILLWPMCLTNSKRQPCFYLPLPHAQEDTQN
jgi:hypothetical protein